MLNWLLCAALVAGAASAAQQHVGKEIESRNIAVLQAFPFVAQLDGYDFWETIQWSQICACSILNNRHCLSAAGCVSGWSYEPRFRRIRAGSSSRNTGGIIFYIQGRINHPDYGTNRYDSDVSVIRTTSTIVYSSVIQQAAIASPGSWIPTGLRLSQPGWGRAAQPALTNQEVLTAERSACGRQDGNFSIPFNATVNILCAIPPTGIVSNDDVGSPWVFNGVTVGLVGVVNTLNLYNNRIATEVAPHTEWIVGNVS